MRAAALSAPQGGGEGADGGGEIDGDGEVRGEMKRSERVFSGASALLSAFIWSSP